MSDPRKFTYRHSYWNCSITFLSERIEYFWEFRGSKDEGRRRIFSRSELSPKLEEFSARTHYSTSLRLTGVYPVLAMFSYALLPLPWRYSTYLFLAFALACTYRTIRHWQKKYWICVSKANGDYAVSIQATRWTEEERENFRRYYAEWVIGTPQATP